jgi:hypothetical protein
MREYAFCSKRDWASGLMWGFGVIVPAPEELEFPTLLTFPALQLNAYPKESVVAEKFEAIVKLGMANSRMKDFYHLLVLAQRFQFESATLAQSHPSNFRKEDCVAEFPAVSVADGLLQTLEQNKTQWRAFLRMSGLNAESSVEETIRVVREFVMPVVEGVSRGYREERIWQAGGPWK